MGKSGCFHRRLCAAAVVATAIAMLAGNSPIPLTTSRALFFPVAASNAANVVRGDEHGSPMETIRSTKETTQDADGNIKTVEKKISTKETRDSDGRRSRIEHVTETSRTLRRSKPPSTTGDSVVPAPQPSLQSTQEDEFLSALDGMLRAPFFDMGTTPSLFEDIFKRVTSELLHRQAFHEQPTQPKEVDVTPEAGLSPENLMTKTQSPEDGPVTLVRDGICGFMLKIGKNASLPDIRLQLDEAEKRLKLEYNAKQAQESKEVGSFRRSVSESNVRRELSVEPDCLVGPLALLRQRVSGFDNNASEDGTLYYRLSWPSHQHLNRMVNEGHLTEGIVITIMMNDYSGLTPQQLCLVSGRTPHECLAGQNNCTAVYTYEHRDLNPEERPFVPTFEVQILTH